MALLLALGIWQGLAGAAPVPTDTPAGAANEPEELLRIKSLRGRGDAPTDLESGDTTDLLRGGLRYQALRNEAMSYGMKSGLAWRYAQIEKILINENEELEKIYNFSKLIVDGVMLPPVIVTAENGFKQIDPEYARSTRVMYRVEHKARIVTTPPHWRDFLVKHYPAPAEPYWAILPKTEAEAKVWEAAVAEGWKVGIRQAETIFKGSVGLITQIFKGILTYKVLVVEGVVAPPRLAKSDLGVTYEGKELNVGDTLYRITSQSRFNATDKWTPEKRDETPVYFPR